MNNEQPLLYPLDAGEAVFLCKWRDISIPVQFYKL